MSSIRFLAVGFGVAVSMAAGSVSAQGQSVKGVPRQDPAKWFSDLDYPYDARPDHAQGTVAIVLSIDTSGRVSACRITATSGNAALDRATCELVHRRGRFTVQTDAAGAPQPYTYAMSKTWTFPSQ